MSTKLQETSFYKDVLSKIENIEEINIEELFLKYCAESNIKDSSPSASRIYLSENSAVRVHARTIIYRLKNSLTECYDASNILIDFLTANSKFEILFAFIKAGCFILKPINISEYNPNITRILLAAYELGACRIKISCDKIFQYLYTSGNYRMTLKEFEFTINELDKMGIIILDDNKIKIEESIKISYKEETQ